MAVQRMFAHLIALLFIVILWQVVAYSTSSVVFPSLSDTLASIYAGAVSGELGAALADSMIVYATGLITGIVAGVVLGILLARQQLLRIAFESYIMVLYATPMVALIPFILSLFGFGFFPKVLVVFLFSFFPVLYNTIEGARSLKAELLEVAESFRSTELQVWRDLLLPHTLPYALTGIRQAIARGLVGMVSAEFFLSGSGIGQAIMRSGQDFDIPGLYAAILVVTVLGVVFMGFGRALENRFSSWRGLER